MPLINHCNGGSSFAAIIQVTHRDNAVCTCSNGSKTFSSSSTSTESIFKVNSKGTWTITVTYGSFAETEDVEITTDGQLVEVELMTFHIYGISRDITASSPEWARTDDAIGLVAKASIGDVEGYSSFDTCYPWSGIQRETFSSNDVMVKIPKFWYTRYREGNVEYIKIADKAYSGFSLHPAFDHGGTEKDCIYVSAYEASASTTSGVTTSWSKSGKTPDTYVFLSDRTQARIKGNGWELMDISTFSALQMLILVEFASNNVQEVIGIGRGGSTSADTTGDCDSVPNLTGIPNANALSSYSYGVVWRGVENLWGNAGARLDGVLYKSGVPYVCNTPSQYSDTLTSNYKALSYTTPAVAQYFVTKLGLDSDYPWVMLPSEASGGGSDTYFCDTLYIGNSETVSFLTCGDGIEITSASGLFRSRIDYTAGKPDGCRLIYIPQ